MTICIILLALLAIGLIIKQCVNNEICLKNHNHYYNILWKQDIMSKGYTPIMKENNMIGFYQGKILDMAFLTENEFYKIKSFFT